MNSDPTRILIAVLYKVGMIAVDESGLGKELSKVADSDDAFQAFKSSPQHVFPQGFRSYPQRGSPLLNEELGKLVLGGLIIRHGVYNNCGLYFEILPRLTGEFGRAEFEKLSAIEREAVKKVAKLIRELWWV